MILFDLIEESNNFFFGFWISQIPWGVIIFSIYDLVVKMMINWSLPQMALLCKSISSFFFFFCLSKSGFGALVKDIFFKNSSKWKKIKLCILLNAKFLQYRMIVLFSPFQTKNWAFQFLPSFGFCRSIRKKNLSNPNRFWKTYQKVSIFLLSICDGQSKNREILFASWFWLSRRNFHPSIFWKWKEGLSFIFFLFKKDSLVL